jgi:hypothetical protein
MTMGIVCNYGGDYIGIEGEGIIGGFVPKILVI